MLSITTVSYNYDYHRLPYTTIQYYFILGYITQYQHTLQLQSGAEKRTAMQSVNIIYVNCCSTTVSFL